MMDANQFSDALYGPLRFIGGALATVIYVILFARMFRSLKGPRAYAYTMRDFTYVIMALLGALGFLIGAYAIINPSSTPMVRFINSIVLGALIVGGLHLLATMRGSRRKR